MRPRNPAEGSQDEGKDPEELVGSELSESLPRSLFLCHHLPLGAMPLNSTFPLAGLHDSYLSTAHPWYYDPNPRLFNAMPDHWFSVLCPVAAYWLLSGFFDILDTGDWRWLQKYKIHESAEVTSRNRISKKQVIAAVILQHIIQMTLGYFWMDSTAETGGSPSTHIPQMDAIAPTILSSLETLLGRRVTTYLWRHHAQGLVYFVYWWAIPLVQLLGGL